MSEAGPVRTWLSQISCNTHSECTNVLQSKVEADIDVVVVVVVVVSLIFSLGLLPFYMLLFIVLQQYTSTHSNVPESKVRVLLLLLLLID